MPKLPKLRLPKPKLPKITLPKITVPAVLARPSARLLRGVSIGASVVMLGGAVAIGGGAPLGIGTLADKTSDAARNATIAADNTSDAVASTEALGSIARSVKSQLDSSERMLETQLRIEKATEVSSDAARDLAAQIERIRAALNRLRADLTQLATLAEASGAATASTAAAAARLGAEIDSLSERFDRVVEESRELNRKARTYEAVAP